MAFVLGVLPLAIATGAGSASQNALGIGVIGGMLAATFLATYMIPMFYVLIAGKTKPHTDDAAPAPVAHAEPVTEGGR
jgi:multidrug efflux pump